MKNQQKTQKEIDAIQGDLDTGVLSQRKIALKHGVSHNFVNRVKKGTATPLIADPKIIVQKVDPTNKKILQLEAQVIALQDETNRCKRAYKAAQRENAVFEALVDEMHNTVKPIKPLPSVIRVKKNDIAIKESLVMHLSDEHADSIVLPHQVGGLERYDLRIALRRAEVYVDTVIRFTQQTLSSYIFDDLYILAHGDHVSGEIHGSTDHSYFRNSFRNALAVAQMHALMFRDLCAHFPRVHILYLSGNHGRRSLKKDYQRPQDNWDYLVAEVARLHCADIENINFNIPDSYSACLQIEGFGFAVTHGDDIRSWNSIPWYGIERKTRRWAALNAAVDRKINYYCFGHFHNAATQAALSGETILNGSWVACDPYSFNSITAFTEPSQWLHGVHHEHGVSWRLNVKLRTEREHLGPRRYSPVLSVGV
jgi:predicted transcriptional regulator